MVGHLPPRAMAGGRYALGAALVLGSLLPTAELMAATIVVSPGGSISAAAKQAQPGDTVLVHAGTYNEKVTLTRSGTSAAPITFQADSGVTVTGQSIGFDLSGVQWTTIQGFRITSTTAQGIRLILSGNVSLISNTVESAGDRGIYLRDSSNVTLTNNTVSNSTSYGIYAQNGASLTISGGQVTKSGKPSSGLTRKGIYLYGCSSSLVKGVTVDQNTDSGIYLASGTTTVRIEGNIAHDNARGYTRAAPGIEIRGTTGNTIIGNRSYSNEDTGIQLYTGADNNLVANNVLYKNGDHGVDNLDSSQSSIIGNSVFGNVTAGINVEGTSSNATIANNVSVDNGINSPRTKGNIRVDSTAKATASANYNLVYLSTSGTMYTWGTSLYPTLAALQSANPGVETNGLSADPLWAGSGSGDFHLRAGSPAIDAANSGVIGAQAVDLEGTARVDDPGTPNTGSGLRPYDDRGAFEYRAGP